MNTLQLGPTPLAPDEIGPRGPRPGLPATKPAWAGRWVSLVPALVMLAVGLIGATRPVLSWDEIATADVERRSVPQIWQLVHTIDGVFAPYYFFMHFWTAAVGATVFDLRLPSIVAMAATVAATAELGRRLFSPTVGFVAGLLLCLIPNTSRYAAEARPYAIACLFSVVALLLLYRARDRPRAGRWIAYSAAVVCLGLSHLLALTAIGAHLAIVAFDLRATRSRRVALCWGASVAIALALLTPVAKLGVAQRGAQLSWVAPLTTSSLRDFPAAVVGSADASWLLIGLALVAGWRLTRPVAEMAFAALVPLVVLGAVSAVGPSFWVARYLLITLAPTAVLAGVALARVSTAARAAGSGGGRDWRTGVRTKPVLRILAALALIAFAAYPGQLSVRGHNAKNGSDFRSAASIIHQYEQPGDGIVYQARSRTLRAGIDYYLRDDAGKPRDLLLLRSAAAVASLTGTEYPDVTGRVAGATRVWLLVTGEHSDPTSVRTELRTLLRKHYQRLQLWHINRATLALFARHTRRLSRSSRPVSR